MNSENFTALYDIMRTLRGPGGCPWDREQTPDSLRSSLIEESYETIDAIDSGDSDDIAEELGDLYMLVTFLAVMYEEQSEFTVADVLERVCDKLVRRHPHVFGDSQVADSGEVVRRWNEIKTEQEGKPRKDMHLDSVSDSIPSLERANALQKKAAAVGFDWPTVEGVFQKIAEETAEVRSEIESTRNSIPGSSKPGNSKALESEIGDLLFSVVNLARYLNIDPSIALHKTNQKFKVRFSEVEKELRKSGKTLESANLAEMDQIWNRQRS